ncbi:MAG: Ig-like domain-containing protein [Bacteroidia bacterium]|jgi:hypothetical protein|nr:Ig-like domain-containing protein [Bacteroidia bacterium]
MRRFQKLSSYLFLFLISGCAQIVSPTGGNKDDKSPMVIAMKPENKTVSFNEKKITISFDEFIQLNSPSEQIIISPPMENKPTFNSKGKVLEIRLDGNLLPNTTYTLNFGNAIGDNKENNIVSNLVYVFSTGQQLDSLTINGKVVDAFNNKPLKDVVVGLYLDETFNDSTIIKEKPIYFSKTDNEGEFSILNLPSKLFRFFAIKDDNKNLKWDKNESIAFFQQPTKPGDSNTNNLLPKIFKPNLYASGKIIDTFSNQPQKFTFIIYKSDTVLIQSNQNNEIWYRKVKGNEDIDTFFAYTKTPENKDVNFNVNINGTARNIILQQKNTFKADKLNISIDKNIELNDSIKIVSNNPITNIDQEKIILLKDSIAHPYSLIKTDAFNYYIKFRYKEKESFKLELRDSVFKDIYGNYSKKEKNTYNIKASKDYASLLLHVKLLNKLPYPVILQIMSSDEKEIFYTYKVNNSIDLEIPFMLPGSYKIKYIHDENKNGKWDNGDLTKLQQPEKVDYFSETLNVKAYWDLEQSILVK